VRLAFDTAVFVYARGRDHPLRSPCRRLLQLLQEERIDADISIETLQEYVHVLTRSGVDRATAIEESRRIVALCRVHDLTMARMQLGLRLFGSHPRLDMADAVHAATALSCLADAIVTPDRDFDGIDGLTRLDPEAAIGQIET